MNAIPELEAATERFRENPTDHNAKQIDSSALHPFVNAILQKQVHPEFVFMLKEAVEMLESCKKSSDTIQKIYRFQRRRLNKLVRLSNI